MNPSLSHKPLWGRCITLVAIFSFSTIPLAACFFAGPSFDAEQKGQLWCKEPVRDNETIVVKGNSCLIDHLSEKASSIRVVSTGEIRSVSFPSSYLELNKIEEGYLFTPNDSDLQIIEFLKEKETIDAIKEHNIKYIIFVRGRKYEEPMPEPYSSEDFQAAILSAREERATYSALVVDAQEALVAGSILQESKGRNVAIPLLATFSNPDPAKSACEAIAFSIAKMLEGDCKAILP